MFTKAMKFMSSVLVIEEYHKVTKPSNAAIFCTLTHQKENIS